MTTYFSDASFKFLRALASHKDKTWFHRQQAQVRSACATAVPAPADRPSADLATVSILSAPIPRRWGARCSASTATRAFPTTSPPTSPGRRAALPRASQAVARAFVLPPLQPGNARPVTGCGIRTRHPRASASSSSTTRASEGGGARPFSANARFREAELLTRRRAVFPPIRVHRRPEHRNFVFWRSLDMSRHRPPAAAGAGDGSCCPGAVRGLPLRRT